MQNYCKDFLKGKCERLECKFSHLANDICRHYIQGMCRYGEKCSKKHEGEIYVKEKKKVNKQDKYDREKEKRENKRRIRNTTIFTPYDKPVDMRVIVDTNTEKLSKKIMSRDVVLVPNLFSDFKKGELYNLILDEVKNNTVQKDQLLKIWHGNDKIDGTHFIANDRTSWKEQAPTFNMVLDRVSKYFDMKVEATRFNWYPDTSSYKSFHHDSAYIDPKKAKIQNFTVAISFGAERECAFQRADEQQTVVSFPIGDGDIYCFSKDTNVLWKHGVLQDSTVKAEGRISCILWGKIEKQQVTGKPKTTDVKNVVNSLHQYYKEL